MPPQDQLLFTVLLSCVPHSQKVEVIVKLLSEQTDIFVESKIYFGGAKSCKFHLLNQWLRKLVDWT